MKRDIRLYYYQGGQLLKSGRRKGEHLFDDEDSLKDYTLRRDARSGVKHQWVMVEYYDTFSSKILQVFTNGNI